MRMHPNYHERRTGRARKSRLLALLEYKALYNALFFLTFSRHYVGSEFQGLLLQQRQISSAADNKEFIFSQ